MVSKQDQDSHSSPLVPHHSLRRYARQIVLPEIGEAGQAKLLASSVLVVGSGGLGSPALAYLAAAGVGRLGIVEPDRVELSNLQRQLLFETADIGRPKAQAAADRLEEINSDCTVDIFEMRLDAQNARSLISGSLPIRGRARVGAQVGKADASNAHLLTSPLKGEECNEGYDLVLDCSDNFETRFAVADACAVEKKPLISGAVVGWSAQLSTFKPYLGAPHPSYRDFVHGMPERERSCAMEGIVGPLAGMVGSMQALEAIKELLGIGQSLSGRVLIIDGITSVIRSVLLERYVS